MRRWLKENPEKKKSSDAKYNKTEKSSARFRRYYQGKGKETQRLWRKSEKGRASRRVSGRRWDKKNPTRRREYGQAYKKTEKGKKSNERYYKSEKGKEANKKWKKGNTELVKGYRKKYLSTHPQAQTLEMTKYKQSHRECEWSGCVRTKSLHVHHILPKFNYPKYVDGDYHGKIAGNFICFCPLHHYAYHLLSTKKDTRHKKGLPMIWDTVVKWAHKNKIPIEDVIAELDPFTKG